MNVSKNCADQVKNRGRQVTSGVVPGSGDRNHKKTRRRFSRSLVWTFVIMALFLVAGSLVLVLPMIGKEAGRRALIRVPAGAGLTQVEDSLAKYFGDDFACATLRAFRILEDKEQGIRHGAWLIEADMNPFTAARVLARGGQTGISVTLNNQRTSLDVARLLASKLEFSEQEFLDALGDARLLRKYNTDTDHALIFFLKDTYDFYWTATPQDVIEAMYGNYLKFWNSDRMTKAEELRLTPREVVILASIVDAETEQASEKGTIGRLYINRLDDGMKLQSDPTVIYALGDFTVTRVGGDMLNIDSPYNTYRHKGLPPGPIRLTSGATIDAILTSRPNDYLYMCADRSLDGTHRFAVTYEEHLENARRYRQALDEIGNTLPVRGDGKDK